MVRSGWRVKLAPLPPSSTDTVPEHPLATARSGSWSPLKSPTATETGKSPTARSGVWRVKLPPALPSSTETVLASWLRTARSGLPSPLKSPTATEAGPSPVATLAAGPKLSWACAGRCRPGRWARAAQQGRGDQDGETDRRMWPPVAGDLGAWMRRRRRVPLDAVRSRHRSQAIAPGAIGSGRTGRVLSGSRLPCSPPLPLDPEPSDSRDCAAESNYFSHPCPNRPAAPAPARSGVTSVERTQVAWEHQPRECSPR